MFSGPLQVLQREQLLPLSLPEAWDFFSDPANLCAITPEWLCFEVCSGADCSMHAGQILTYRVRPFPGLSMTWVTEITHVREPYFFVDEQRLGPYRFWHHQHHFEERDGGTLMRDIVHYILPLGIVGQLVAGNYVQRRLKDIFEYRASTLRKMFD
jgi:ligand-binding SRPBCC domain-containing protein